MMKSVPTLVLAASSCFAPASFAQTLYKHIDKDGKVTYSDAIPHEHGGKASRLRVDPTGNTVMPFRAPAEPEGNEAPSQRQARDRDADLTPGTTRHHQHLTREARARAEAARKAFEDTRDNPTESDFRWVVWPNYSGGMWVGAVRRRVFTEDYLARLEGRLHELRRAEEELKALERSVEF